MADVCEQCGCEAPAHYGSCPTLSPAVRGSLEQIAREDEERRPKAVSIPARHQGKTEAMRQLAMASLDELQLHAPTWVNHIRAYIAALERRR